MKRIYCYKFSAAFRFNDRLSKIRKITDKEKFNQIIKFSKYIFNIERNYLEKKSWLMDVDKRFRQEFVAVS